MFKTNTYTINEGTIEIPNDLIDQTINVFATGKPNEFSMSISRETMPWGVSFEEYTLAQIERLKEAFEDYTEVSKKMVKIGKDRCPVLRFHWKSPAGILHQVVTFIENDRHVVVITGSFANSMSENQYHEIVRIFQTYKPKKEAVV